MPGIATNCACFKLSKAARRPLVFSPTEFASARLAVLARLEDEEGLHKLDELRVSVKCLDTSGVYAAVLQD